MKVLIVSYAYTPDISPRAFRWATIAELWAAEGHQVDVVCGPGLNKPVETDGDGVNVYRVGSSLLARARQRFNVQASEIERADRSNYVKFHAMLAGILRWLHDRSWRLVYWPDLAGPWFFAARRQIRALVRVRNYDAFITVSPLFTSHVVGLSCRRSFSSATWLADYGDPFSYSEGGRPGNNRLFYRALNRWVEDRVLRSADVVSVTTDETRELYARLFPETGTQAVVVPPLIPEIARRGSGIGSPNDAAYENKIVLTYTGHFYPGVREPDSLLALIDALLDAEARYRDRIQINIVGPLDRVASSFRAFQRWPGVIKLLGQLPPDDARREIDAADGLINIGNTTPYQLPSKVVEYVASGKPILNLCLSAKDSSARFFDDYPLVCNVSMGASSRVQAVQSFTKFLDEMIGQRADPDLVEKLIAPYTPGVIAAQYADLITKDYKARQ